MKRMIKANSPYAQFKSPNINIDFRPNDWVVVMYYTGMQQNKNRKPWLMSVHVETGSDKFGWFSGWTPKDKLQSFYHGDIVYVANDEADANKFVLDHEGETSDQLRSYMK